MRPARLAAALLAAALAVGWAQDGYYPSEPGMSWTYSNGETQTLSGPRDVLGGPRLVLVHYLEGVPVSEEYLDYGAGVLAYGTAAGGEILAYAPPLTIYPPAPLRPGDAWSSTTVVGGIEITLASEVLGQQGIETPAGRFNALRVRQTTLTSTGGRSELELYFVPSVGVVRYATPDGGRVDLIERSF